MRKVSRLYENPIDNLFINIADAVSDSFHRTGHTPNVITTYSALCGVFAIRAVESGALIQFIVSMTLCYFFDCLDGFMARKYNQETVFGDLYDHVKDIVVVCGVISVVLRKYGRQVVNLKVFAVAACLFALMMVNFGCQQQRFDRGYNETLDVFKPLCRCPDYIRITRMFGSGTMIVVLIGFVAFLMHAGGRV